MKEIIFRDFLVNMATKLVRDKIPEIIKALGKEAKYHIAIGQEYQTLLKEKLMEECREYLESEDVEELADILEAVEALAENSEVAWGELMKMKEKKAKERGGFRERIVLES